MSLSPVSRSRQKRKSVPSSRAVAPCWVVGIGASTGGLEAFSQLLVALPPDTGMTFVLVQHLAPKLKSLLAELLALKTALPVVQAEDGMVLRRDHVVVIPPDTELTMTPGRLHLAARPRGPAQHLPIDAFFRSLAHGTDSRCVAIVLSGAAADGAQGLREVKAAGGITIAQDPASARCAAMPHAAIATGAVDRVLAPAAIAVELARIAKLPATAPQPRPRRPRSASGAEVTAEPLSAIFDALRRHTSVDFVQYKRSTVLRRLQRRMELHHLADLVAYGKLLRERPEEVDELYRDLLIHVTAFFRDGAVFEALQRDVLPRLLARRPADAPLRIWVPGCSTGEEPYSLAIGLIEAMDAAGTRVPVRLFATDVSESAIEQARAAVYPASIAGDVSPERLARFFTAVDGAYRLTKAVRDLCIFARHDVTRDPPFSRLELVLCRNLLIYLDAPLQRRLLTGFHYALKPGGYLLLGAAESIGTQTAQFGTFDAVHRIFVRKPSAAVASEEPSSPRRVAPAAAAALAPPRSSDRAGLSQQANELLLARYAPAGVIVDADLRIVQFRGATGAWLEPPSGEANLHLLKMVRAGLLRGTRAALAEARRTGQPAERSTLLLEGGRRGSVVVLPMAPPGPDRHHFVLFEEEGDGARVAGRGRTSGKRAAGARRPAIASAELVAELRHELAASRDYLQTIQQDFEAAHEELQSANEEILSNNEELQSANEELDTAKEQMQSSNEELHSINAALRDRNEVLAAANRDLFDLVACASVAAFVIDSELRVGSFTPRARTLLGLVPADVGRSVVVLAAALAIPQFESRLRGVVEGGPPSSGDFRDGKGRLLTLRIEPLRRLDGALGGATVALFEPPAVGAPA
ncbi:MAG: PAS domain-containing protein [Planctomycetes bacterium]|nr:PAS domain-containing protein [Planctomycetota bacterium]